MAQADGKAMLLVRHPGIGKAEIAEALRRRWLHALVEDAVEMSPVWDFGIDDAVELARAKRGVEPLRIVVMAQRYVGACSDPLEVAAGSGMKEPMPSLF
jgi:hypothetical protein